MGGFAGSMDSFRHTLQYNKTYMQANKVLVLCFFSSFFFSAFFFVSKILLWYKKCAYQTTGMIIGG